MTTRKLPRGIFSVDGTPIDVDDNLDISDEQIMAAARVNPQDAAELYFQRQEEQRRYGLR